MTENYDKLNKSELLELIASKDELIISKDITIKELKETIEGLKKRLFGRKSEKREKSNPEEPSSKSETEDIKEETKKRRQLIKDCFDGDIPVVENGSEEFKLGILPDNLERREEVIDQKPADWSEQLYTNLEPKITERLVCIPASYYVQRIIRPVYVRKSDSTIMPTAAAPWHVFGRRCQVSESVIIKIIIDRFYLHLPYYRQEKEFRIYGLRISRDNMYRWCNELAVLFAPIVNELEKLVKSSPVVHIDETPFSMNLGGKYGKAYFWPLLAKNVGVAFRWTELRNQDTANLVLEGLAPNTTIVTDGLNLYKTFADNNSLYLQVCWAHIRRKFDEAIISNKQLAEEVILKIGLIFKTDKEILKSTVNLEAITKLRLKKVKPLLDELIDWSENLAKTDTAITSKNLRIALNYLLKRKDDAQTFLTNPLVKLHNNDNERESKNFKLGAKNWLFISSDAGADALCIFYSLIQTAIMHQVNPYDYLLDLCARLDQTGLKDIDLIPQNWKKKFQT